MKKTVLLIGSGAREHAIARAILGSGHGFSRVHGRSLREIHCFASGPNPGIEELCGSFTMGAPGDAHNGPETAAALARRIGAKIAVIGPEAPLASGTADALRREGIGVIGPGRKLARLESSKSFTRGLISGINPEVNPRFASVSSLEEAGRMLDELGDGYVIKAEGLRGGKGVKVSKDHLHSRREALEYCCELIGQDGACLIEEKLEGEEFSLLSFTDGTSCIHMPPVQDHKRAFEGDEGPNTGGMGSYTGPGGTLPFLRADDITAACRINEQLVEALRLEAAQTGEIPYCGIIYGGFMACARGVRVVEYNARFGDPEGLNLLALLETDLLEIFQAMINGTLSGMSVRFSGKASVCKYVVPFGYPDKPAAGGPLDFSRLQVPENLFIGSVGIQAHIPQKHIPQEHILKAHIPAKAESRRHGKGLHNLAMVTGPSRTAAVVALGESIAEAERKAEEEISRIAGDVFHRRDIGTEVLIARRTGHMAQLRGVV